MLKTYRFSSLFGPAAALLLAGCATVEPVIATHVRQPDEPAERNFTSFSDSLRCMDDLFTAHGARQTLVTSNGFPDLTSSIRIAADDMLVRAIGLMNARSHAYVFIDQALEKDLGQNVYITERPQFEPEVYFRGAISQYHKSTVTEEAKLGLGFDLAQRLLGGAGLNGKRIVSVVTVDMHLVAFPDKLVVPGASVSNSMVIVQDGLGGGLEGIIGIADYDLTLSMSRVESPGQAVRNLIELGTIELLGRHAGVPYWQCLSIDRTQLNNLTTEQTLWWAKPMAVRRAQIQGLLERLGYLSEYRSGEADVQTRRAISRFQADNRLIATGTIDYDLFARLREMAGEYNQTSIEPPHSAPVGSIEAGRFGGEYGSPKRYGLKVRPVGKPARGFDVGDKLEFEVSTARDAYVRCYYQAATGGVYRVFPNSNRDPWPMKANDPALVPGPRASFDIVLDTEGRSENVLCVASGEDHADLLPAQLSRRQMGDTGMASLDDVLKAYFNARVPDVHHRLLRVSVATDEPAPEPAKPAAEAAAESAIEPARQPVTTAARERLKSAAAGDETAIADVARALASPLSN